MSKAAEAHIIILNVLPNVSLPALYNFTDGLLTDTLFKEKSKPLATKATVHSWALAKSRKERLQLPTALPFLAMGPAQPGLPLDPGSGLKTKKEELL